MIQWYGQACFKIQSGELVVAIDPYAKEIGLTPPRFRADVVLVTHGHRDHANSEALAGSPLVITGPGEYDVKGISVLGMETFHDAVAGKERGLNTAYQITMEEIRLLHLGDFGEQTMREETLDAIGAVDILMIPVGGVYTIDGARAAAIVRQIEPKIVIPMHYRIPGLAFALDEAAGFLSAMGLRGVQPEEKLTTRKKELEAKDQTTLVLMKAVAQ